MKGKGGIVFPMPPSLCPLSSDFLVAPPAALEPAGRVGAMRVRRWRFYQIIVFQQIVSLQLQSNLLAQSSALVLFAIEMSCP